LAERITIYKSYGFITFETENEATKVLTLKSDLLKFKDTQLNVSNAYKRIKQSFNHGHNLHTQSKFNATSNQLNSCNDQTDNNSKTF
jgi:hypothetical protein